MTPRLVNPQPIDTMPDDDAVWVEWENPISGEHHVAIGSTFSIRFNMQSKQHGTYHAWSYTATTEPE